MIGEIMVTSDCQQQDIIWDILSCFYIKRKWCKTASKWNQSFKALSFSAAGYTVNHSLKIFVSVSSEFLMNRLIHCFNQTGLAGRLWRGVKMTIRTLLQHIKNTLRSSAFNLLVRLKYKIKKPYLSLSPPVQIVLCCTDNWGRSPLAHLAWGQQGHVCRLFPLESTVTCHLWEWTPQHLYLLTKWSVCVYTLPLDCRVAGLAGVYSLSIKNPDGQNTKKKNKGWERLAEWTQRAVAFILLLASSTAAYLQYRTDRTSQRVNRTKKQSYSSMFLCIYICSAQLSQVTAVRNRGGGKAMEERVK